MLLPFGKALVLSLFAVVFQQCLSGWGEGAGRDEEAVNPGTRRVASTAWSQNGPAMKRLSRSSDPVRCHLF